MPSSEPSAAKRHQQVARLAARPGVVLAHGDEPGARRVEREVRMALRAEPCDGRDRAVARAAIDEVVLEVGEPEDPAGMPGARRRRTREPGCAR
jgi:hypothetical protein